MSQAIEEEMVLVKFPDGAKNHFPASIANDNKKLKEFVRGMGFAELAEAKIERSKDKDGNTVVTFVKQAGKKGQVKGRPASKPVRTPLDVLVKARPFDNPSAQVAAKLETGERVRREVLFLATARAVDEFEATNRALGSLKSSAPVAGSNVEEEL